MKKGKNQNLDSLKSNPYAGTDQIRFTGYNLSPNSGHPLSFDRKGSTFFAIIVSNDCHIQSHYCMSPNILNKMFGLMNSNTLK